MSAYKKKLIEVALPLEAINRAGRADKNRKTGTIRNLHKWFAPMPTPVWRALLAAAFLDDPEDQDSREEMLRLIEGLVPGDGTVPGESMTSVLRRAAKITGQEVRPTTVVDPFVGGGSTLVEAQRLGFHAEGGDLNPVPALISRTIVDLFQSVPQLVEPVLAPPAGIFQGHLQAVTADLEFLANEVRDIALARIGSLYPSGPFASTYAYLWAHAVSCPNPACAVTVPLYATQAIFKSKSERAWIRLEYEDRQPSFRVVTSSDSATEPTKSSRGTFSCPQCGVGFGVAHVKEQKDSMTVLPVAVMGTNDSSQRLALGAADAPELFLAPARQSEDDETPLPIGGLGLTIQAYGLNSYEDLLFGRQYASAKCFAEVVHEVAEELPARVHSIDYARLLSALLGLSVGKLVHANSRQSTWRARTQATGKIEAGFGQPVITMVWDFAEANPFGGAVGDWSQIVKTSARALAFLPADAPRGTVVNTPAVSFPDFMTSKSDQILATDPPYFDAIGYADLSDFFYIWHRAALRDVFPDLYATVAANRFDELIADRSRHGGDAREAARFFIEGFRKTFERLTLATEGDFPFIIVYAHQQREDRSQDASASGWEALLDALISAGLTLTASWPIHCTSDTRLRGQSSNALSSYVALICRRRSELAGAADRRKFLSALRTEMPQALRDMQQGSIAPIDLAQASIGPGMRIFSQFAKVIEADGSEMSVRTALALINQVRDEVLSEQEGDFDSETRFAVKWFSQYEWNDAASGEADVLSRAVNTTVSALDRGGIFRAAAGKARLLEPSQMTPEWNPADDKSISIWEVAVRLGHSLQSDGLDKAADLMRGAASKVDLDAVKELAYLMYSVSERRGWTESAMFFNALGTSWGDVSGASRATVPQAVSQVALDFGDDDE